VSDISARIYELERKGYIVWEAVSADGRSSQTHSRSCVFVCVDGNAYWVKATAQQGLVSELIGGRLARLAHRAPTVAVIRVTPEALPVDIDCSHLTGVVFGSQDLDGAENARDLGPLIGDRKFEPKVVNHPARARVIAFQSWLGVGDAQILVRLADGGLFSFDHGDAFQNAADRSDPTPIVVDIPGVDPAVGRRRGDMAVAVKEIEDITDDQIIAAVSNVPHGQDPWQSPVARRAEIVEYLIHRRSRLRDALMGWSTND
jgi:hypothetical protein